MFIRRATAALGLLTVSSAAWSTLGIFEHGNGIKSMGMGGLSYAIGEEVTTLSVNPAHALHLGTRYDLGVHVFNPMSDVSFTGNAAAPDSRHRNDGRRYFAVPQGGFTRALSENLGLGMTAYAAGLGPDYPRNPYARFGGTPRGSLFLNSAGVATALAWRVHPRHVIGASLNLGYQTLSIEGLGFLAAASGSPAHVSNQGKDGAFNVGASLGWRGELAPGLTAALAYRSKSWTQKHREYQGLLPDGGRLELPAIWGAGLAYAATPDITLGFDFQRYQYSSEPGFGNRLSALAPQDGRLLGDEHGPGFGFANQNVYKLGVAWKAAPTLTLRAGYLDATQIMQPSETLFGMFGPATSQEHYTAGFTWLRTHWEVSGFAAYSPFQEVHGRNSIPAAFGGGEASVGYDGVSIGVSFGRRFGS